MVNGIETAVLDHGRIIANRQFIPLLMDSGLDSFDEVMNRQGGTVYRDFPGRRTVRLELQARDDASQAVFLKRYESHYLSPLGRLLRILHWPGAEDEAMREWRMCEAVSACGVPTAVPIAVGQSNRVAPLRSFLLTAEIQNPIDSLSYATQLSSRERRELLVQIAKMAAVFHGAGFVHKDYYLGHVVASFSPTTKLYLLDLQRVTRPRYFRSRWIAKDLGALAYSALKTGITRTVLLSCYHAYSGNPRLTKSDKQVLRAVVRRINRLQTRRPKYDGPI